MNCMSLNIRGVGETHKVEWIRKLKFANNVDFIGLQETRISDYNHIDIDGCWGSSCYEFEAVNPTGRSGGILCIWDPGIFFKIKSSAQSELSCHLWLLERFCWSYHFGECLWAPVYNR